MGSQLEPGIPSRLPLEYRINLTGMAIGCTPAHIALATAVDESTVLQQYDRLVEAFHATNILAVLVRTIQTGLVGPEDYARTFGDGTAMAYRRALHSLSQKSNELPPDMAAYIEECIAGYPGILMTWASSDRPAMAREILQRAGIDGPGRTSFTVVVAAAAKLSQIKWSRIPVIRFGQAEIELPDDNIRVAITGPVGKALRGHLVGPNGAINVNLVLTDVATDDAEPAD